MYQLREERNQHDKILQETQAGLIQSQASLKAEFTQTIQHFQSEDTRRQREMEMQYNKLRDQLIQSQALDMEKVQDKHRREIRQIQAQAEVNTQESIVKIRHLHEQELNRQIRENDRLHRLLARHGLSSTASNIGNSSNSNNAVEEKVFEKLTPASGFRGSPQRQVMRSHFNTVSSPPPPPPPPPVTTDYTNSNNTNSNSNNTSNSNNNIYSEPLRRTPGSINWGALEESLQQQEDKQSNSNNTTRGGFSNQRLPPADFPLDEAVAASRRGNSSSNGLGIGTNVRRVSSYLQQLEAYLQVNTHLLGYDI